MVQSVHLAAQIVRPTCGRFHQRIPAEVGEARRRVGRPCQQGARAGVAHGSAPQAVRRIGRQHQPHLRGMATMLSCGQAPKTAGQSMPATRQTYRAGCTAGAVPPGAGLPRGTAALRMSAHPAQRAQQLQHSRVGREGGNEQQRAVAAGADAAHDGHPDLLAGGGRSVGSAGEMGAWQRGALVQPARHHPRQSKWMQAGCRTALARWGKSRHSHSVQPVRQPVPCCGAAHRKGRNAPGALQPAI